MRIFLILCHPSSRVAGRSRGVIQWDGERMGLWDLDIRLTINPVSFSEILASGTALTQKRERIC